VAAGGLCPPAPPRFIASGPIPERRNRNGTPLASRLRSWSLARRSGRVSASPCPPARSPPMLSAIAGRNHWRCAQRPIHNRPCSRPDGTTRRVAEPTKAATWRRDQRSDRRFRVRYTRSWAVVIRSAPHFFQPNPWVGPNPTQAAPATTRNPNSKKLKRRPLTRRTLSGRGTGTHVTSHLMETPTPRQHHCTRRFDSSPLRNQCPGRCGAGRGTSRSTPKLSDAPPTYVRLSGDPHVGNGPHGI